MVRPSGDALSDSQVPSSVSNSILRWGVRGKPGFFWGLASWARRREAIRTRRKRCGINRNYKGSGGHRAYYDGVTYTRFGRLMPLEIPSHPNDDPLFIDLACRAIAAELQGKAAQEVFVIRIDNWFDHKWLNFSGIGRVGFRWNVPNGPDTALDEFRQGKATFPPFSPNRVVEEHRFQRGENGSYSLVKDAPLVHSQTRASSCWNLHRRIANFSGSALFAWFSSKTDANRRGSLMVYRANGPEVTSWYSSFAKESEWRILRTEGIGREELRAWIEGGNASA